MSRRISGAQAQKRGVDFERFFTSSCSSQFVDVTRIPDGCKQIGAGKIIRVRTPFDFILSRPSQVAFIDTKLRSEDKPGMDLIHEDQVRELIKLEKNGHVSGYIVYLREAQKVLFIRASTLLKSAKLRSSKPMIEEAILLGTIFKIDLSKLFDSNKTITLDQQGAT